MIPERSPAMQTHIFLQAVSALAPKISEKRYPQTSSHTSGGERCFRYVWEVQMSSEEVALDVYRVHLPTDFHREKQAGLLRNLCCGRHSSLILAAGHPPKPCFKMAYETEPKRIHVWYIYLHENHTNQPNVGKYTIHGSFGE